MKNLTLLIMSLIFLSVGAHDSYAQSAATASSTPTTSTTANSTQRSAMLTQAAARRDAVITKAAEKKQETQTTRMENLRTRATKEIDRRIEAMNGLLTKIAGLKKLSQTQKTDLTTQIQTEITSLTDLKTKIAADTDLTTLQTDVKSIVASYRIFALFLPKIHIFAASESLMTASDLMTSASAELAKRVQDAKNSGQDTTTMESSLLDLQAKIADARTQAQLANDTVMPLLPSGYPANRTSLDAARLNIRNGTKDLQKARDQARTIITLLKSLKHPAVTPKPTEAVSSNSSTTQ